MHGAPCCALKRSGFTLSRACEPRSWCMQQRTAQRTPRNPAASGVHGQCGQQAACPRQSRWRRPSRGCGGVGLARRASHHRSTRVCGVAAWAPVLLAALMLGGGTSWGCGPQPGAAVRSEPQTRLACGLDSACLVAQDGGDLHCWGVAAGHTNGNSMARLPKVAGLPDLRGKNASLISGSGDWAGMNIRDPGPAELRCLLVEGALYCWGRLWWVQVGCAHVPASTVMFSNC